MSGTLFARLSEWVGLAIPLVTAALIVQIFAANIGTISGHLGAFAVILIAISLRARSLDACGDRLGPCLGTAAACMWRRIIERAASR
ncbi:hypothetical protein [Paracoccus mutanolyticus]|uniref:hypothetical protein n=1 Tax=Paracoccus mutanolyticus TaxID=1499308 RepID=UPI001675F076|nr:hypothetical protein [Paracoccus mutanolyticus]